jgi:hypothetical protein
MTDQEMGVSNAVRGVFIIGGTGELLLVGTTDCYEYTKTENIKHFEYCVLSDCILWTFSGWIIATRHSPQHLSRAYPSHFYQGSSPCQWIIHGLTFQNTVMLIFIVVQTADIRNVLQREGRAGNKAIWICQPKWQLFAWFFLDFLTLEDGSGRLFRNVGRGLPLYAAEYHRRAQIAEILVSRVTGSLGSTWRLCAMDTRDFTCR